MGLGAMKGYKVGIGIGFRVKYFKLKAKKICPFPPALPKHKKYN